MPIIVVGLLGALIGFAAGGTAHAAAVGALWALGILAVLGFLIACAD